MNSIREYLPSKKFSVLLLIIVCILLAIFFGQKLISRAKTPASNSKTSLSVQSIVEGDRDGDGVRDWEESLWGTDPDKKDSNGDGIEDGQEIETRRNALAEKNGTDTDTQSGNQTEEFSKTLFATIISLKEKGSLNSSSLTDLSNTLSDTVTKDSELPNILETKGILTTKDQTLATQKSYLTKLQTLIFSYEKKGIGYEYKTFADYVALEDNSLLATLSTTSALYKEYSSALAKMQVPDKYITLHLSLVNNSHNIGIALENMAQSQDNELVGAIGIGQYKKYNTVYENNIKELSKILVDNAILDQ